MATLLAAPGRELADILAPRRRGVDLFPLKLPSALPRARVTRLARRNSFETLLGMQLYIAASNWLVLGKPRKTRILSAAAGSESASASGPLVRLQHLAEVWVSGASGALSMLGRHQAKFKGLSSTLMDLLTLAKDVEVALLPYGASRSRFDPLLDTSLRFSKKVAPKKIDASRLAHKHAPTFNPEPFISDPLLYVALRRPRWLEVPRSIVPSLPPRALVHAERSQLIALLRQWDAVDKLELFAEDATPSSLRCGLFLRAKG